jgi:hypothetical protein
MLSGGAHAVCAAAYDLGKPSSRNQAKSSQIDRSSPREEFCIGMLDASALCGQPIPPQRNNLSAIVSIRHKSVLSAFTKRSFYFLSSDSRFMIEKWSCQQQC